MSFRARLRETSALAGGLAAALLFAAPAFAQDAQPAPQSDDETTQEDATQVGEIVVTGSRIPRNEFTSTSPVQVLSTERAQARGVSDTGQLLQSATVAAGSPQVNSTISSAFVTDGGPGASTISLRGLGANRTLVLLNGRRAGPAGTRGGVSAFDLNVLPQSALSRVDILKDGASSIYGSDAVAGVVNLITNQSRNGGDMSVFYTAPFESGGEQLNISGTWGRTFSRGHLNISADYYKQFELKNGDRDYTSCAAQYVFYPNTGARADMIDPRTGKPHCGNLTWGQIYAYSDTGQPLPGRFQYDYDGNLGSYIPTRPPGAAGADYPIAPSGFYVVGYDPASRSVANLRSPFDAEASLIPEVERYTVFVDGAYQLTDNIEAYGEVLLNRRESSTNAYRQYWNYAYTEEDPTLAAWSGNFNFLSPTPITDHFDSSQRVDYARVVGGLRGDINGGGFLDGWKWDIYAQYSRSDGDYTQDVILNDAVESQSFRTDFCAGDVLPISGRTCIDIDWTDPQFLAGNLTQAQRDFLFDRETGNTLYTQAYVEGFIGGDLMQLPAGPLGAAFGFHLRRDEIKDVPGEVTLANNSWGLSGAGVTEGDETTSEVFAEFSVPILKDRPFFDDLSLTLSGRYTDVKTSGDAGTYKIGLNWAFTPEIKLRASTGTSFRAPALFELYLADQTSFLGQRSVDPCINWGQKLQDGDISQQFADNCAAPTGPGGGVAPDFAGGVASAQLFEGGGLGNLEPETSTSNVIGLVWTPSWAKLSVALDYFEIEINDEVTSLGANTVSACYLSDNFPTDPICSNFDRDPSTGAITAIRGEYINIAEQTNRGIDLTARYIHDLPWGDTLNIDAQATWQLESRQALFADNIVDTLGEVGNPQFVGNVNIAYERGPWTLNWAADMIGSQSNYGPNAYNGNTATVNGYDVRVVLDADFMMFHSASVRYDADEWSITAGVANLFDSLPPQVTTLNLGELNTIGTSVLASQYTEGYYGRRAFIRLSKSF